MIWRGLGVTLAVTLMLTACDGTDGFFGFAKIDAGRRCLFNVQCAGDLVCVPLDAVVPSPQMCATPRERAENGYCNGQGDCAADHECKDETLIHNGKCLRTSDAPAAQLSEPAGNLAFLTYNAGLAYDAVALAEERKPEILTALTATDADVICLQEVWKDGDIEEIKAAMQDSHPYSFHRLTEDTSKRNDPCGVSKTLKLNSCVSDECDAHGISAEECVQTACKEQYDALGDECVRCLTAHTTSPIWCALWGTQYYVYDGRNGLLLLSRYPIEEKRYTALDTLLIKRGILSANVAGYTVHCGHLSSDLDVVPYDTSGRFESWEDEQIAQVEALDTLADIDACTIVLGDLNMGPGTDALSVELPDAWDLIGELGFVEPWPERQCTWCKNNSLTDGGADMQLDHVLFRNCQTASASYSRVLDEPLSLETNGASHDTRLSDHYGLRASLELFGK
jgi:endonuclease/exonuclease/phosphatase family metal-dependent hydrolase